MNQTIEHKINDDILTIEQSKLGHSSGSYDSFDKSGGSNGYNGSNGSNISIKFEYLQHTSQNRYEIQMNQSEINSLSPIFQVYPDYYWKLFNMEPDVIIRVSSLVLRWNIELICVDDQPIDIHLQLVTGEGDALFNRRIQSLVEDNNRLKNDLDKFANAHKMIIIRNIWSLNQTLQICGQDLFIDYFAGFDFVNRQDKYVQQFYNVLATGTFSNIYYLIPVFKALCDTIDPNYPITAAPLNEAADIISNVGRDKMHTLFTRMVHYMMNTIAARDTGSSYKANVETNKGNMYSYVPSYLLILNTMVNKADFTKLLCGTSKANPGAGTIKQLADRWFEPMIRHINTLPQSDENQQTVRKLNKLRMATYL